MSGSTSTTSTVTYIPFQPSNTANFSFTATLDGDAYIVTAVWNLFSQRYYLNITDVNQNLIVLIPMISSAPGYNLNIVNGYFNDMLVFRGTTNNFEITNYATTS